MNCFEPLDAIVTRFNLLSGMSISNSTARRYPKKLKIRSCVAVQKQFLSKGNIIKRIAWAHRYRLWSLQEWSRVTFSDESAFTVHPDKIECEFDFTKVNDYIHQMFPNVPIRTSNSICVGRFPSAWAYCTDWYYRLIWQQNIQCYNLKPC